MWANVGSSAAAGSVSTSPPDTKSSSDGSSSTATSRHAEAAAAAVVGAAVTGGALLLLGLGLGLGSALAQARSPRASLAVGSTGRAAALARSSRTGSVPVIRLANAINATTVVPNDCSGDAAAAPVGSSSLGRE